MTKTHFVLIIGTGIIGLLLSVIYYYIGRFILKRSESVLEVIKTRSLLCQASFLLIFVYGVVFCCLVSEYTTYLYNNDAIRFAVYSIFPLLGMILYWNKLKPLYPARLVQKFCIVLLLSILPSVLMFSFKMLVLKIF